MIDLTENMPTTTAELLPPLGDASLQGIIVREADGTIDFRSLRESGFSIVYLRATAGNDYVDCRLDTNIRAATQAGLEVGFAHYLTARTVAEARQQAEFFLRTIRNRSTKLRTAMFFDRFRGLDIRTVNAVGTAFLAAVQSGTGVAPLLRTDAESANLIWTAAVANAYPLWVVDPDAAAPDVSTGKWRGWTGWEYGELVGTPGLPLSLFTSNVRASQAGSATKLICVTVAYGDTLSAIARLFGTTVNDIVELNAIANPNRIYPGQRLFLRVPASTPVACCDTYIVRRGDTLGEIAERFGTTVARLVAINQIPDEDLIVVGQAIRLGLCEGEA